MSQNGPQFTTNADNSSPKPWFKKKRFIIPTVIVVLVAIGAGTDSDSGKPVEVATASADAQGESAPSSSTTTEVKNDEGISLEEYNQLQSGMTYTQVVAIVGSEGENISQSDIAGYETVMYDFEGEKGWGSNASLMFQNNKLNTKSQFGLK